MLKRSIYTILLVLLVTATARAQDMEMSEDEARAISSALERAIGALEGRRYDEAISFLEPLTRRPDAPPQVHALLGAAYIEANRPQQALATLEPLIEKRSDDPAVLYNAGRAALAIGRFADGEAYLERAARLAPGSPAARTLGLLRGRQGRVLDAYRLLRPLALADPSDAEVRLAAAAAALQLMRTGEAEALLSDLPQSHPQVRLLWGRLLLLKGEAHTALGLVEPLADAELPEALAAEVRRLLANLHLELGDAARARELLSDLALDPGTAYKLAQAAYQSGDLEAAIRTLEPFREALVASPEGELTPAARRLRAGLAQELGRFLIAAGRHGEAVTVLEAAVRLDDQSKQAWQSYGQALAAIGRQQEAEQALARFSSLAEQQSSADDGRDRGPGGLDDATARELRKASQLVGEGRFDAALGVVRTELALVPEDPRPRLAESRILLLLGRHDDSLASAERALGKAPASADAWYQRGAVKLATKDFDGAEADLRHALELNEGHAAAMNDLAVLLIVRGKRAEARALLERALELNPNDRGAAQNLARLDSAGAG